MRLNREVEPPATDPIERPHLMRRDRPPDPANLPAFCPRCRRRESTGVDLCPACGDRIVSRGYCPVCEAYLDRELGDECPKHDVELVDRAGPSLPTDDRGEPIVGEKLVVVATYPHPNQANAPRIRLEAEGIPTFLDGERVAGSTLFQVATGGVRLMVPDPLAASARVILAQTWDAPADPSTGDHLDDEADVWAGLEPAPGTRRRAIMKVAIFAMLFGPGLIAVLNALLAQARR